MHKEVILEYLKKHGQRSDKQISNDAGITMPEVLKVESLNSRQIVGTDLYEIGIVRVSTFEFLKKKLKENNEAAQKSAAGL